MATRSRTASGAVAEASVAGGVVLLAAAGLAPIDPVNAMWASFGIGAAYAGLVAGAIVAVRASASEDGTRRRLRHEAALLGSGIAAGIAVAGAASGFAALVRPALTEATAEQVGDPSRATLALAVGAAAALVVALVAAFAVVRPLVLAWPAWRRQRATRLAWALAHAQVVGALALAGLIAGATLLALVLADQPVFVDLGADPTARDVLASPISRFMLVALPTALAVAVAGVAGAAVLIPLVVLASHRPLRRTAAGLERLAQATGELRLGALGTRVEVAGEDEVGRLQADFNAMAADLQAAVTQLQAERDRVAGLLAERRELVAAVSHELRTPVATVRAHLETALEHWGDVPAPTLRADLEVMDAEAARLQQLIDDLFDLARAEVGRLSLTVAPTDVAPLLARGVDALRPFAARERRVELALDAADGLPPVRVDPGRLDQIVRNLLVNAIRHSPPGGVVVVSAAAQGDGRVAVAVEDGGPGIEPDDLPRIWDRFYQGRSAGDSVAPGAGIGLALVKELAEAMGGSVSVTSTAGQGSRFTVLVPAA